jgi:hypothetical protein
MIVRTFKIDGNHRYSWIKETAIAVRETGPTLNPTPQDDQLMSERRILCLKSALRLEWQGQHGQNEADQRDHRANLADSIAQ